MQVIKEDPSPNSIKYTAAAPVGDYQLLMHAVMGHFNYIAKSYGWQVQKPNSFVNFK